MSTSLNLSLIAVSYIYSYSRTYQIHTCHRACLVWSNIKPAMIEYMEKVKPLVAKDARIRFLRARRAVVHAAYIKWRMEPSRLTKYPSRVLMPGPADIMEWSPIAPLINRNRIEQLEPKEVEEKFRIYDLDYFIKYWRHDSLDDLRDKARSATIWGPMTSIGRSDMPIFELAVVVYRCDRSHWGLSDKWASNHGIPLDANGFSTLRDPESCMWYPEFIFHPCNSIMPIPYFENAEYKTLSVSKEYKGYRRREWTSEHLHFDDRASRTVKNILEACGMNWARTTVGDMDKRNDRFVCLKCTFGEKCDGKRTVRVWSWRDAVDVLKTNKKNKLLPLTAAFL